MMGKRFAWYGAACVVSPPSALAAASVAALHVGEVWNHPYWRNGLAWTWAWLTYALDDRVRTKAPLPVIAGAIAGIAVIIIAFSLAHTMSSRRKSDLYGRTGFASMWQAWRSGITFRLRPDGESIVLGCKRVSFVHFFVCLSKLAHVSLTAMTGAGKGVGFVIPNLLTWTGSGIFYDIKGELWEKTAGRRLAMGQRCFRLAPDDENGKTHRYNPYSAVDRRNVVNCIDHVHEVGHILIPDNPMSREPYFDNIARDVWNGVAVIFAMSPGLTLNIGSIRSACLRPDYREYLRGLIERARKDGRALPMSAVNSVLSWVNNPDDRGRTTVQSTIQAHVSLWASPRVCAATETSDFDLRELRAKRQSIYLAVPPTETRRYRPLTSLLFQQAVSLNWSEFGTDDRNRHRVLMMLDEFWSMGQMSLMADAAAFIRSAGFVMCYVLQSKAQVMSTYGQEGAENLFENTGAEITFGVKGLKAAREFSEMTGDDTVQEPSQSGPRFGRWWQWARQTESLSPRKRPGLLPQEIRRLDQRKEIIYRSNELPLLAQKIVYYRDRYLRRLSETAPEVSSIKIDVVRDAGQAAAAPQFSERGTPLSVSVQYSVPSLVL